MGCKGSTREWYPWRELNLNFETVQNKKHTLTLNTNSFHFHGRTKMGTQLGVVYLLSINLTKPQYGIGFPPSSIEGCLGGEPLCLLLHAYNTKSDTFLSFLASYVYGCKSQPLHVFTQLLSTFINEKDIFVYMTNVNIYICVCVCLVYRSFKEVTYID